MELQDQYRSIAAPSEGLFKDNGSRFIALAYPVETEEEVKSIVAGLRKEYHDARHHSTPIGWDTKEMSGAPATTESLPAAPAVPFWDRLTPWA